MRYKLCVPVMDYGRCEADTELLAEQLRASGADAIFLVFDRVLCSPQMLDEKIEVFEKTRAKWMKLGFKVNAWLAPTIGYGGKGAADNDAPDRYVRILSDKGNLMSGAYCPLDENFSADFMNTLKSLAQTGVEEILFEDDYTLTGGKMWAEHGCCCERHMALLRRRLGENISREFLSEQLYAAEGIRYRREFLKLMGETLAEFTKKAEKTVHEVNPNIRIGLSANASSYRMEGIDFGELSKLTAGSTKPFIRMTGAPYWDQIPTFATNIEAIRLQAYWLRECGAELICEGDTYPRPRFWVPSVYLEGYDMILRADGCCDGILKYMTDYTSKADYETGYIDRHIKNIKHYEEIQRRFSGKKTVGLNIIEDTHTFENAPFDDDIKRENFHNYGAFQPLVSQWFATDNSLPIAYGQNDCASLVFGENAHYISEENLKNGVIIDAYAAKILMKKGIDVGIKAYNKTYRMPVEYFREERDYTIATVNDSAVYYDFELKETACVLSEFLKIEGGFGNYGEHLWETAERCPACYFYRNDEGHKFLVYAFTAELSWGKLIWTKGLFRNYYRQAQLCKGIEMLQGRKLPAVCLKNPELYILCKKDSASMAIGLWNFFADEIINPEIILDGVYAEADFYNCSGKSEGNKVVLDGELAPYSFAFVTVSGRQK